MALLISYTGQDTVPWVHAFRDELPEMDVRVFPDEGDPADVEFIAVWQHPHGGLKPYVNLKAILSCGAGVEHITSDPDLPEGVPIIRLVDEAVVHDMCLHGLHWVLHFHRGYHYYAENQRRSRWQVLPAVLPFKRRIGIMGMGQIGQRLAEMLSILQFSVAGWGLNDRQLPNGIKYFSGAESMGRFLSEADILINALPLTPKTKNLIDANYLSCLPKGAFIINISRGGIVNEKDLRKSIESGRVEAAALDVFAAEPLPQNDPFWTNSSVHVTPHIGGINYPASAAQVMAANIKRIQRGIAPFPVLDPRSGY
ncbi:MAG: glyoxylate/hydroxypyruvate reductase A [Oceanospirillaceae bacterium]|jgi:glyoxylate/hydroxypyruvate reductase A|nr:glyoxylate/hydroxypyruvate reductase A [Oceanospirillaceae bacterium]|tara:strand:- start:1213 stop:2145 length:933 start_codon:yes stop_codon:yes gene_type:complete